jgi:hypothetical protein
MTRQIYTIESIRKLLLYRLTQIIEVAELT